MKRYNIYISCIMLFIATACNKTTYVNVIPEDSKAIIAINIKQLNHVANPPLLKSILHVNDLTKSGLDLTKKIYLFEDGQGNLGLCASVEDKSLLQANLHTLGQEAESHRGGNFTIINDNWIAAFTDNTLLVMGPVAIGAHAELQNIMAKYLQNDKEESIEATPIYDTLDTITSPIGIVANVEALPDKLVAPFTLGVPPNANSSDIFFTAGMSFKKKVIVIDGQTFSFNQKINESLQKARQIYRPIKGRYLGTMNLNANLGFFLNVNGRSFLPVMKDNPALQSLLIGINSAIDMDNIVRSVDGEMSILTYSSADDQFQMSMGAELGNLNWLADVDYWKKSCPPGARILKWGKNHFYYKDGKVNFYFGVTDDQQFMSGSSEDIALRSIAKNGIQTFDPTIQKLIVGSKLAMVVNLRSLLRQNNSSFSQVNKVLKPFFGDVEYAVYRMK